jgi:hypothetical protein
LMIDYMHMKLSSYVRQIPYAARRGASRFLYLLLGAGSIGCMWQGVYLLFEIGTELYHDNEETVKC